MAEYDWRTSTVPGWNEREAVTTLPAYTPPANIQLEAPNIGAPIQVFGAGIGGGKVLRGPLPGTPPGQPVQVAPAPQVAGVVPAVAGAMGVALPAWLIALLGVAGAGYAGYQALGGGEGGGLFGTNLLGGDEFTQNGLEFSGPGLPEPTQPYTEWHTGNKQFYYVPQYSPTSGKFLRAKVAMYNKDTKKWKVWTLPKPHLAVIGKNAPSHRMLTRLRHNLKRHTADAKTILQVSSPAYYAKMSGYHKHHRR